MDQCWNHFHDSTCDYPLLYKSTCALFWQKIRKNTNNRTKVIVLISNWNEKFIKHKHAQRWTTAYCTPERSVTHLMQIHSECNCWPKSDMHFKINWYRLDLTRHDVQPRCKLEWKSKTSTEEANENRRYGATDSRLWGDLQIRRLPQLSKTMKNHKGPSGKKRKRAKWW